MHNYRQPTYLPARLADGLSDPRVNLKFFTRITDDKIRYPQQLNAWGLPFHLL